MSTCTLVLGIATNSLNKPWTEDESLLTTVGKILFNDIMPEELPYLQSQRMLTDRRVPAKYFLGLAKDISLPLKPRVGIFRSRKI